MMNKPANIKNWAQVELWIVTVLIGVIFLVALFEAITFRNEYGIFLQTDNITLVTLGLLFRFLIIYISYLLLCFYMASAFDKKEPASNNSLVILAFIVVCTIINLIDIYFGALLGLKILVIYFNRNKANEENRLNYEAALLVAIWLLLIMSLSKISTSTLFVGTPITRLRIFPSELEMYVLFAIPVAIMGYLYAVYFVIPKIYHKKWRGLRFLGKMILLAILSSLGILVILLFHYSFNHDRLATHDTGVPFFGNFFGQLFLVTPIAWNIFKSRQKREIAEITSLKTQLNNSDANLNFLKSQINPHFLFNALNTLYGTALQENAERTGEGIQKLGDMMRFMLQENMQNKIALSRDIDYLNSYILLQKLRTSVSPDIVIQAEIEAPAPDLLIAPMLLIPFVENAFKHGISLIHPSFIKIKLNINDTKLYFDVYNSIHTNPEQPLETELSGVGLENVKQRLGLLYPEKHELIIRETAKEFIVHLTLELERNV